MRVNYTKVKLEPGANDFPDGTAIVGHTMELVEGKWTVLAHIVSIDMTPEAPKEPTQ